MSFSKIGSSAVIKKRGNSILAALFRYFMLMLIGYIVLYPLLYMLSSSVKSERALLDVRFIWLPRYFSTMSYETAFEYLDFFDALWQTVSVQIVSALTEVLVCAFVAYGFARFKFKGRSIAYCFLILTLMIPLPMYSMSMSVNYRQVDFLGILGLINKLTGIDLRLNLFDTGFVYWLPSILGIGVRSGMLIYIYMQFFAGLPNELEDAAYVDGSGPIGTFFKIALPSSNVVLVTATVLSIVWHWNETYLAALCFSADNRPLSVMLSNIQMPLQIDGMRIPGDPMAPPIVFAGCLLFIAIPLALYLILQRKFVKSIDRVGITG